MTTRYEKRLRKLANHLLGGKLAHEEFDFRRFNESEPRKFKKNGCGTSGCAIGECPAVFPKHWRFQRGGQRFPMLRSDPFGSTPMGASRRFFGLTDYEYYYLFTPRLSEWAPYVIRGRDGKKLGRLLSGKATAKQVGNRILKFCARTDFTFKIDTE